MYIYIYTILLVISPRVDRSSSAQGEWLYLLSAYRDGEWSYINPVNASLQLYIVWCLSQMFFRSLD